MARKKPRNANRTPNPKTNRKVPHWLRALERLPNDVDPRAPRGTGRFGIPPNWGGNFLGLVARG
jgi:hypothetical protein